MSLPDPAPTAPLLEIGALRLSFRDGAGGWREVLQGLDLAVGAARTVALVGESGSGKSVAALAVMGLLPPATSRIEPGSRLHFEGHDLLALSPAARRSLRGSRMAMVFQDPMSSLNPVFPVGDQIAEVLRLHAGLGRREALARAVELIAEVGLAEPGRRLRAYPHQLSGGQQQRIMIAMALAAHPRLLVADEPTTALDAGVQRQILELLASLQARYGMGLLFISHDLGVVSDIADEVVVMCRGEVRERGAVRQVLDAPADAYTRRLLACRPGRRRPDPAPAVPPAAGALPLLEVRGLSRCFELRQGWGRRRRFTAVDAVSFTLARGETLGVVGESGSGKSTLAQTLLHLQPPSAGEVRFDGRALAGLTATEWLGLRRRMQIVFQNPYAALNPRFTIAEVLEEPLRVHRLVPGRAARRARAEALLAEVQLEADALDRYPHQFSGGQRQRIAIARCLALTPQLLVLDESVSALDVQVQHQVLELLRSLQRTHGLSYLFISHDLGVVRDFADRVLVMHQGRVVETCAAATLFDGAPLHPYTRALVAAQPGQALRPADP